MWRFTKTRNESLYIPRRFEDKITNHLLKNRLLKDYGQSLILAIQGSPGDGKTTQTFESCKRADYSVIRIDASDCSGKHEGDADAYLKEQHEQALVQHKNGVNVAIVIDDLDMSVAGTANKREYTVNSQLLSVALMEFCDVKPENGTRVPIFVTGNDLTTIHKPLMRHGRSELFTWCPTQQEKFDVVKTMLLDVCGKDSIVWSLIKSFSDQPISFFSSLRSDAVDQILAKYDCRKLLEQHRDEIQRIIDSELGHGDGRMLLELANQRSTRITTNFLNTEIDS